MIRHIVLARFRRDIGSGEIAAIFSDLEKLRGHIPGMLAFHGGCNTSPENLDRGYSHAFTVDFADAAARDAYLDHQAHKAAGSKLVAACEGGVEGIVVTDIAI